MKKSFGLVHKLCLFPGYIYQVGLTLNQYGPRLNLPYNV